jgi:nitrite reductase/ring-hydroxylating ferredoxin subunit
MTRRKFLVTLAVTGTTVAIASMAGQAHADDAAPYFVNVGPVKNFPVGQTTKVDYPAQIGGYAFVRRDSEKAFAGLSPRCVHRGVPVTYDPATKTFECPRHHARYSETGEHLSGPGTGALAPLQAKVDKDGNVWLQSLVVPAPAAG